MKLKVIELFGGIGAPRKALTNLGIECEYDYVEWDKHAVNSYNSMYGENFTPIDVSNYKPKWNEPDLIVGGFPCQDLSVAGKQAGLNEGTRSNLFKEMVRICLECSPKNILFENVKQLINQKHWPLFMEGLKPLFEKGYQLSYQVINGKQFIPQNRERVFVLLSKEKVINIDLKQYSCNKILKDYLQPSNEIEQWYFNICPSMVKALEDNKCKKLFEDSAYTQTITTKQHRWNNAGILHIKGLTSFNAENYFLTEDSKYCKTITATGAQSKQKLIINLESFHIRYLTELECWRLMGFSDHDFYKAKLVNNRTQLYKQAGNSIIVPVLETIFNNLFKEKNNEIYY